MIILVLDVGTSSIRSILFEEDGSVLWKCQAAYGPDALPDGAVEMNMELFDKTMERVLKRTGNWLVEQKRTVSCISVTAQRSSVIPVGRDGKALKNAMMWQDTRAVSICEALEDRKRQIYKICGMIPSPVFSAPKMRYIKEHFTDIYQKAHKLIGFQEYVICFLTGEFYTDYSIASRTCLFDIARLSWSEDLLELFHLEEEKLCGLIPAGSVAGTTKVWASRTLNSEKPIPVISAGGDQQCAALGLGCQKSGEIIANSGTGSYVIAVTDRPLFDEDMRVNCNLSAIPGMWMVEGAVLSAGKSVNWLNSLLFDSREGGALFGEFSKACEEAPAGANGLIFVPLLAGKGTPAWRPEARGRICGIGLEHKKGDLARALLEGIAAEMKECAEVISQVTHDSYAMVKAAGGLTRNKIYNQILADFLNCPVTRPENDEATGLGAWISAAVGMEICGSHEEAYQRACTGRPCIRYEPIEEHQRIYTQLYRRLKEYEMNC